MSGPVRTTTNFITMKINPHNDEDIYIQEIINLLRAESKPQTVAINC